MFIGTLKLNRALQIVFLPLTILFWLLAIGDYTGSATIAMIAGYESIFCGFTATYAACAQVLNEVYGSIFSLFRRRRFGPGPLAGSSRLRVRVSWRPRVRFRAAVLPQGGAEPSQPYQPSADSSCI